MPEKLTKEEFIERARKVHGDKYDYSKVNYINAKTKVCIICPEHGEFWQKANNHISSKQGCPECGKIKNVEGVRKNTEYFINKAVQLYGDKYDYSKVNYINAKTKVEIVCRKHGFSFWQTPANHLWFGNTPCPKCKSEDISSRLKYDTQWFINKAKGIHGDKYDYSKVKYDGYHNRVCIICPEHGEFWQFPTNHYKGVGCPICKSPKGEMRIKLFLEEETNEEFVYQYRSDWLKGQSLDFFFPKYNFGIEYDGEQHFAPVNFTGHMSEEQMNENLRITQERDKRKDEKCVVNGIKLFRIKYDEDIEESLTKILKLYNIEIKEESDV